MSNLYKSLDIPKDADQDDIKKAYRRKSMDTHPDKGGTCESLMQVQRAYEVLSDRLKRYEYDQKGEFEETDINAEAAQLMTQTFVGCLVKTLNSVKGVDRTDLVKMTKRHIGMKRGDSASDVARCKKRIKSLNEVIERLTCDENEIDYFTQAITEAIMDTELSAKKATERKEICSIALKMLERYEYEKETEDSGYMPSNVPTSLFPQIMGDQYNG